MSAGKKESDGIRIVVHITDANPELLAEFERVSPRSRAERIRILATLGLRGAVGVSSQPAPYVPEQRIQPSRSEVRPSSASAVPAAVVSAPSPVSDSAPQEGAASPQDSKPKTTRVKARVAAFAKTLSSG